jgi:hypothetical protein
LSSFFPAFNHKAARAHPCSIHLTATITSLLQSQQSSPSLTAEITTAPNSLCSLSNYNQSIPPHHAINHLHHLQICKPASTVSSPLQQPATTSITTSLSHHGLTITTTVSAIPSPYINQTPQHHQ